MATETTTPFEIDERWFAVLASSPRAVLVQHKQSGSFTLFKLEWRERGVLPASFASEAWAMYMDEQK